MIGKMKNEIQIKQDFSGRIGLYLYKNHDNGYFTISNSFIYYWRFIHILNKWDIN